MKQASWIKGRKRITGRWNYIWSSDRFVVILDSKDPITGRQRELVIAGERPEFNGWKLSPEENL